MGKRLLLLLFGLASGVLALELFLQWWFPRSTFAMGRPTNFSAGSVRYFQTDPQVGYLPIPGTDFYDRNGCQPNNYRLDDRQGRKRILFVGDSVTRRGSLIQALRALYGDSDFEYWNAGVEGFNTAQELALYRRDNHKIKPDLVVLTFHNNDYQGSPAAILEQDGSLTYTASGGKRRVSPWLMRNSYLYRLSLGLMTGSGDVRRNAPKVRQQLADFRDLLKQQKAEFRIILFPLLRAESEWNATQRWSREEALRTFRELELRYFDVLPSLASELDKAEGLQERAGDDWHPNARAAERCARELKAQGLLDL